MLSLKLYEMISLCFSLLVCPSTGKVNVVKYKKIHKIACRIPVMNNQSI